MRRILHDGCWKGRGFENRWCPSLKYLKCTTKSTSGNTGLHKSGQGRRRKCCAIRSDLSMAQENRHAAGKSFCKSSRRRNQTATRPDSWQLDVAAHDCTAFVSLHDRLVYGDRNPSTMVDVLTASCSENSSENRRIHCSQNPALTQEPGQRKHVACLPDLYSARGPMSRGQKRRHPVWIALHTAREMIPLSS